MCVLPKEVCLRQKTGRRALRLHGKNTKDSVYEDVSSCETVVSNCGGNAPPRMTHVELYGTMGARILIFFSFKPKPIPELGKL
jgi:hypothetical protein